MANRMISFGYGIDGNKICVIDSEAQIVKEIFEKYSAGKLLQEIADELSNRRIDFFQGNCCWNKNKISRIIENQKYIGNDGYPPIVSRELFQTAYNLKNNKGCKKGHFSGNIEYLKKNATCAQCGKIMTRRSKWRSREKWLCGNGCKNDVYVDDALIFSEFGKIISQIQNNPEILNCSTTDKSKLQNFETIQCRNELRKIMDSANPDFKAGKEIIFQLAKLNFLFCEESKNDELNNSLLSAISNVIKNNEVISEEFLSQYVTKLQIEKDGTLTVTFINGGVIASKEGGEEALNGCYEKDNNENRSRSKKESYKCRSINSTHGGILQSQHRQFGSAGKL